MQISNVQSCHVPFRNASKTEKTSDKNPITKRGEEATLLKATVVAGLGLGGRALLWLCDEGFMFNITEAWGEKIVDKNAKLNGKSPSGGKYLAAWVAVTLGFVAAVSAVYTLYKTPEIVYNSKVNAFKKGKDMDVYVKGNKVERELYDQMNEKAKDASFEEKKKLAQQYIKLRMAKNQVPDFIEGKNIPEMKNK